MHIPATSRLHFRLLSQDDAGLLFEVDQDELVMKYINGGHKSSWQDIEQRMLPRMQAYRDVVLGYGLYGIFANEPSAPWLDQTSAHPDYVGWVLVRPMNFFTSGAEHDNLELGWRLKRACWGHGIASEAASAIAREVCNQRRHLAMTQQAPAVTQFSAIALPDNHASTGVMKKLGMRYIKRYIHRDPLGDYDVVLYRMDSDTAINP